MRRTVELWIGSLRADLADDSFILFNYTMEDLAAPAIVRNSFSRQVTLPGTTANNRIFGEIFRNDRVTQYSANDETAQYFDPTRKTTWRIYDERSELLESGYLRLDSVTRKRNVVVEYKVTLYGGLGSFLYGLSYDAAGEKRTIAGLNFRGTNAPDTEFNFTLNATAVRVAWARLGIASGTPSDMWDFINFAPAYNGKPTGTFDAGKGLLDVVATGIDPTGAGVPENVALVTLAQDYNEWQTKDLRSYLQRPVLRLRSLIEAICAARNNGGWAVTLDPAFFNDSNPYWQKTWLTLPIVDTENIISEDGGSGSISFSIVGGDASILEATVPGGGDPSKSYVIDLRIDPYAELSDSSTDTLYLYSDGGGTSYMNYVQYTINAYDASNNLVGQTAVRVSSRQPGPGADDVPQMDGVSDFLGTGGGFAIWAGNPVVTQISGNGIRKIRITAVPVAEYWGATPANPPAATAMWPSTTDPATIVSAIRYSAETSGSGYSYSTISGGRSGKNITKAIILSGGGTPADYLLSLCKTFGLVLVADGARKTVSVELRRSFYSGGVVDITDRIDTGTGLQKVPFAFDSKWYVWGARYESGEWAKYYAEKYGRAFGQHRVDTGYAFDATEKRVLDGSVFRGAVMALECAKYFCAVNQGATTLPSVLLDRGAKYSVTTLREKEEVEINLPNDGATITWMNSAYPSYDLIPKAQFHDKEDKPFDERDSLLFFDGMFTFEASETFLPWNDMTHPADNRSAKYLSVRVNAGDVVRVQLSDYTTWRFAVVVLTENAWGSGTIVSDTGWQTADLVKTVDGTENNNYLRITISRRDNGNFSGQDGQAALTLASATRGQPGSNSPYTLTDDTQQMLTMNSGTPCWLLQWGSVDPNTIVGAVPRFGRYLSLSEQHQGYVYERSLDFGVPSEIPIPGATFLDGATIWPPYFAKYIADRYDDDSAVVTCKVNLAGLQVGPEMMRRFYWFDGAVWALNRIINYSVTTEDLTECEFVKVQDVTNYTT